MATFLSRPQSVNMMCGDTHTKYKIFIASVYIEGTKGQTIGMGQAQWYTTEHINT